MEGLLARMDTHCTGKSWDYDFPGQTENVLNAFKGLAWGGMGHSLRCQALLEAVRGLPVEQMHRKIKSCQARGCSYSLQGLPKSLKYSLSQRDFTSVTS